MPRLPDFSPRELDFEGRTCLVAILHEGLEYRLNTSLRGISLFTGAGGLDLGFEAAGIHPEACFEIDSDARRTIEINKPRWNLVAEGDIEKLRPSQLLGQIGVGVGELDVLFGGPPCQPFSKSAYWARDTFDPLSDPRTKPLLHVNRLIEAALPRAVVLENVANAAGARGNAISFFERALERINRASGTQYKPHIVRCNAVDFGVPQLRERAFVVAFRDGNEFEAPAPTCHLDERRTAWDAIGNLTVSDAEAPDLELRGKWAGLIPSIPEGSNYLHHTCRGSGEPLFGWRTRYWSFLLKLAKDRPAWTLQASPGPATGPFHWENRLLSLLEMKRLQSFPDDYEIAGSYRSQRRQLGNAVPPALAEAVGRSVASALGVPTRDSSSMFVLARSNEPPAPETPSKVPAAYLTLKADHKAHPGTGRGPGARERAGIAAP